MFIPVLAPVRNEFMHQCLGCPATPYHLEQGIGEFRYAIPNQGFIYCRSLERDLPTFLFRTTVSSCFSQPVNPGPVVIIFVVPPPDPVSIRVLAFTKHGIQIHMAHVFRPLLRDGAQSPHIGIVQGAHPPDHHGQHSRPGI